MKKTMKIFALAAIAVLTIGLTGCSKYDEEMLVGTWNIKSWTITSSENDVADLTYELAENVHMSFTFNQGNTGTYTTNNYGSETETTTALTYSIDDKTLILNFGDNYVKRYDILELDNNRLAIRYATKTDDGSTSTITYNMTKVS